MIVDYEGSPVFDCLYMGAHYTVKGIDDKNMVSIEKPGSVIGAKAKTEQTKVEYNTLKEENEHFMMILTQGKTT